MSVIFGRLTGVGVDECEVAELDCESSCEYGMARFGVARDESIADEGVERASDDDLDAESCLATGTT
jgi:hypothetical protein